MRANALFRSLAAFSVVALASCESSSTELTNEVSRRDGPSVDAVLQLTWPDNEPAGMTTLTHIQGDTKDWPGWNAFGSWSDPTRVSVASDPDSKFGQAVEKRFLAGDVSGWGNPTIGAYVGPGQTFPRQIWKELYVRLVWKYSANWDFHSGGEKLFTGKEDPNRFGAGAYVQGGVVYPRARRADAPSTTYQWIPIIPGSPSPPPNIGIVQGRSSGYFPGVTKGEYHTVEVWLRKNDPGVANGSVRFWLDGIEYTRFYGLGQGSGWTDVSMGNLEFWTAETPTIGVSARMEAPMFWGGQGDVKTVNDWLRVSEFYMSGRNEDSPPPPPPAGIGTPVAISTQQGNNHNGSITFTVGSGGVPQDATLFVDYAVYADDSGTSVSVADDGGNIYSADWEESDHGGAGGFNSLQWGHWRTRITTALSQGSTITISGLGTGPSNRRFRAHAYYVEGLAEDPLIDFSLSSADQDLSGDITANPEAIFLGSMYTRCTESSSEDLDFTTISEGGPGVSIRPVRLRTSYRIIAEQETRGYEASPGGSCAAYRSGISAYQAEQL